ncbi:MAG: GNAT family acetyltransferase [Hyphomicrobiales bacterium]
MTEQPEISFRPIEDGDVDAVISLWERCGLTRPWNEPLRDVEFARGEKNSDILVGEINGELIASVMVGHDGHRGVVYYLSVEPDLQGKGLGHQVMRKAEDWLKERGVWKLNLMMRAENARVRAFYESLGYEVEERLNMARRLLD